MYLKCRMQGTSDTSCDNEKKINEKKMYKIMLKCRMLLTSDTSRTKRKLGPNEINGSLTWNLAHNNTGFFTNFASEPRPSKCPKPGAFRHSGRSSRMTVGQLFFQHNQPCNKQMSQWLIPPDIRLFRPCLQRVELVTDFERETGHSQRCCSLNYAAAPKNSRPETIRV